MSTTNVIILNLVLLAVVLESDLGRRRITAFRILRPLVGAGTIVPFFFGGAATRGWGLALEAGGVAVGLGLGVLAGALLPVRYDPTIGRAYSRAGVGYAALWVAITGGRIFFAYGAQHLFGHQLGSFLVTHRISPGALADAFIFLSLSMFLTRTCMLLVRGRASRPSGGAAASGRSAPSGAGTTPVDPAPAARSGARG